MFANAQVANYVTAEGEVFVNLVDVIQHLVSVAEEFESAVGPNLTDTATATLTTLICIVQEMDQLGLYLSSAEKLDNVNDISDMWRE